MFFTRLRISLTVKQRATLGAIGGALVVAVPLLVASANLPPVRSSGAPGEVTCTDCHSGGEG